MGSDAVEHPDALSDAWRALAADLLSPEYRAAMTALTGRDLTQAPAEPDVISRLAAEYNWTEETEFQGHCVI